MHIFTMIGCRILYLKNKRMYRILAYRVSLDRRCQNLENIKVTKILWNPILAFAAIGPIGLIIRAVSILIGHKVDFGVIHLFYNLSFIIAIAQKYFTMKKLKTSPQTFQKYILGPLGKFLPTNSSIDHYFADLKKQWN
uniref:Uncharacterized protein n=1 Tax=Panagrolaimus sp. PS1159 TaxID=55785 RepID=A0AC35FKD3_9BILA